jgi:putative addiction module component (TIGR02574 family)
MSIDEVRPLALELSREERELLGIELLCSLEPIDSQAEIESEWAREIAARSDAYRNGKIEALDASETFERLRKRLAERNAS